VRIAGTVCHARVARGLSGRVTARHVSACVVCVTLLVALQSGRAASAYPAHFGTPPPPGSGYAVEPVCRHASGGARCLSLRIVPKARGAATGNTASGEGLTPADLHDAYSERDAYPENDPQTIAIVAAYNDPTALEDLKKYSKEFHLQYCTRREHCFEQVNQHGDRSPLPPENGGWAEEISLDIEVAHAICENCHILLVEAESEKLSDLEAAEDEAAAMKATEISNSWAFPEPSSDSSAFDHKGIVITAGSGDEGYLNWTGEEKEEGHANYPASSPHVVSVGGTRLIDSEGKWSEEVWNGERPYGGPGAGGSGCSTEFTAPYWQFELSNWASVGCHSKRAVADIAADADPRSPVEIYDSTPNEKREVPGWQRMGGTSLAAPLIAGLFAVAGGSGGVEYPARTLYENALRKPESLRDVVFGSNGSCAAGFLTGAGNEPCSISEEGAMCSERAICVAGPGYDGPSGLGGPKGVSVFEATGAAAKTAQQLSFTSAAPTAARVGETAYTVTASASSGLPVSFSSQTPAVCALEGADARLLAPGTCTLEAEQPGDGSYQAATPVEQSFTIARATQTVTFSSPPPGSAVVGGESYEVSAEASSGLAVTVGSDTPDVCSVEGSTVSFTAAGTCTVAADQAGDASYEPAPEVTESFTVTAARELASNIATTSPESSGTLSFSSTSTASNRPDDRIALVGAPEVSRSTGTIAFSVSIANPGALSWKLTLRSASFLAPTARDLACPKGWMRVAGRCRGELITFAAGRMTAAAPGRLSFTARPAAPALAALRKAAANNDSLSVTATLGFQSALGGTPGSQTLVVADRLRPPRTG
jgi:Subtilase family